MKRAICVVAHDNYSYNVRIKYLERILKERGYEVTIISSDFDHRTKKKYSYGREGLVLLPGKPYKKNISLARILSHRDFAKKSLRYLKKEKPDLVFASGAPNFVYKYTSMYKCVNKNAKIIFDVTDMWPETFPVSGLLEKCLHIPFKIWKSIRVKYLPEADYCLFECKLFENIVKKDCPNVQGETLYLCEDDYVTELHRDCTLSELSLLYLGSINNIIDTELIVLFVRKMSKIKKIHVHVIGTGEKKELFCDALANAGAHVHYHGPIYNDQDKEEIFAKCHFALNVMKTSVCVGATMKSIEYFRWGMPLLNTIQGDTTSFVEEFGSGFNICKDNLDEIISRIGSIDEDTIRQMGRASRMIYEKNFCPNVFDKKINKIINYLEG